MLAVAKLCPPLLPVTRVFILSFQPTASEKADFLVANQQQALISGAVASLQLDAH